MPQSHKHKQLWATEMSLSDCAINDLSQKSKVNSKHARHKPTTSKTEYNIKLSSGELRLVSHSALNSTLCSANKHIIVPWCVSDRIIRAGMDSPAGQQRNKKGDKSNHGNSSLGRWVLNCSYSRHNLLACIIYTKCKCLIAFLHFFAIPKTTGL